MIEPICPRCPRKRRPSRLLRILRGRSGETLVEALVSLVVFTILITTVSTMIAVAMRITGNASLEAKKRQDEANLAILGTLPDPDGTSDITLTAGGNSLEITVELYKGEYYKMFTATSTSID